MKRIISYVAINIRLFMILKICKGVLSDSKVRISDFAPVVCYFKFVLKTNTHVCLTTVSYCKEQLKDIRVHTKRQQINAYTPVYGSW